ncbi:hypothetical protein G6L94_31560 [Agrobacterium rhizogenes]|uniref:hypothetical protein n=1 Tax=Rhizobium rhizogenes TaxID=359 RepID=UPI00080F809E|nr:hypothetical protein [Rhizobium rhizogenes]OCJ17124.1 hypothetical protein A6U88_33620 [Agrobacterium sp. B131/95]OCJ22211.1 hypothetical protein A6U89_33175 [Agrobacterium sp. B133/95]NTI46171.1 hypothetical protein [Rhizobium rhizogenes]NTI52863.1 hypothetical protein [Rhizobium rhizogenes]NTI98236.1 hypothetical protein [Rhizobium rhizogenes]
MIAESGYDGVSADFRNRDYVRRLDSLLKPNDLRAEGQCYPATESHVSGGNLGGLFNACADES